MTSPGATASESRTAGDGQVEAVLFDLDDTLCRYRRSGADLLELAFAAADVEPFFEVEAYYDRYGEFSAATDSVEALREEAFAAIAADAGRDPAVGRRVARAYAAERDHGAVEFLPGAAAAVEVLAADHRLGVVTNGAPEMQGQKLAALGLADAFETVVHAGYDDGTPAKPAAEPFHRALDALSVDPSRAVHVGNSLASDVAGARAAGLRAAWVPDAPEATPDEHVPDHTLETLADLAPPPWRR